MVEGTAVERVRPKFCRSFFPRSPGVGKYRCTTATHDEVNRDGRPISGCGEKYSVVGGFHDVDDGVGGDDVWC